MGCPFIDIVIDLSDGALAPFSHPYLLMFVTWLNRAGCLSIFLRTNNKLGRKREEHL